jgi:gamma-glutamyltranspeptidase / glutathione hydrolase
MRYEPATMQRGVIAAGSPATAEAGAEILARGGNAVDAAVAACFATGAGEPALTSLAGGGMMIHRDGATGEVTVCDFFADAPALRMDEVSDLDFFGVHLDFGPTTQEFHIGAAAAAVPGVIPGLCSALARWGTMDLEAIVGPACKRLRQGVIFGDFAARTGILLQPILTHSAAGRQIYAPAGHPLREGERFVNPALADTLEALARGGGQAYYDAVLVPIMAAQFGPAAGGLLTEADLRSYEVRFVAPLSIDYRDHRVTTPAPPAAGGAMIAMMLRLLESEPASPRASLERIRQLAEAMAVADEARSEGASALAGERFEAWRARYASRRALSRLERAIPTPSLGHTTHVSVVDVEGNAAAVTFTFGEGNGSVVGETGIMMNNLMGEADLQPLGFGTAPAGMRLSTMMSPTLLEGAHGFTALGTGGANRIRSAVVQAVANLVDHALDPQSAVAASRLHFEGGVLNAEIFDLPDRGASLPDLGADVLVRFDHPSLFFGGVHLVECAPDGALRGAADHRRGGAVRAG